MYKKFLLRLTLSALLVSLILAGCNTNNNLPKSVESEIEKQMGTEIYVPKTEDLYVTYASIQSTPKKNNYIATIRYAKEKGEKVNLTTEQGVRMAINKEKILYGEYQGKKVIDLRIYNSKETTIISTETKEINGVPVKYKFFDTKKGKMGNLSLSVNNTSYTMTVFLDETYTEEDAFAFVQNIIDNTK